MGEEADPRAGLPNTESDRAVWVTVRTVTEWGFVTSMGV